MSKTKTGLVREAPAEKETYDWNAIAAQLRGDPGEWYRVFERDRLSLATAIKNGGITALRTAKGFEVKTRNNVRQTETTPRLCALYLRYNPAKDEEN